MATQRTASMTARPLNCRQIQHQLPNHTLVWCVTFCLDCSVPSVYSINYRRKNNTTRRGKKKKSWHSARYSGTLPQILATLCMHACLRAASHNYDLRRPASYHRWRARARSVSLFFLIYNIIGLSAHCICNSKCNS